MPLELAMALSGIDRDQWGDFMDLYDHGAELMKKRNRPRTLSSRAPNSVSSSRSSSPSGSSGIGSMTANSPIPLTLRDFCLFKIEALRYGDKAAMDIIEMFDVAGRSPKMILQEEEPYPVRTEVKWFERNLLDLESNLKGNESMYQPANIPQGVDSFFQNRSQISRLIEGYPPTDKIEICSHEDCEFESYHMF